MAGFGARPSRAQSVTEFTRLEATFRGALWRGRASNDKMDATESKLNAMRVPIVAVAAAVLSWGVATAQTGPEVAPPLVAQAPQAPQPDATSEVWSHMTPDQRRQLWQQLTPQERATIWQRLPPEQRSAIRERLTAEQRESIRERWSAAGQPPGPRTMPGPGQPPGQPFIPGPGPAREQRGIPPPGPKLTPEERHQLREEIRQAHRELRRGGRHP
jgi:hypothetical protein